MKVRFIYFPQVVIRNMKKQAINLLALSSLWVLLAVIPAFASSAILLEANIPFDFTVGTTTLLAGAYTVTRDVHAALRISSREQRRSAAAITDPVGAKSSPNKARLVFNRYGDQYFLTQAWLGNGGGYQLWKSRKETVDRRP